MPEIPQNIQDQAGAIQGSFNATVTAIRSNGDLTDEARLRRLAQAWTRAEGEMGALRHSWQGTSHVSAESLTKQIFGSAGADALSVRDADDRASRLEHADEAFADLRRAFDNDDKVLARAIALHAFNHHKDFYGGDWAGVVDAYAEATPGIAEKVIELANLRTETLNTGMASAFVFSIHKPAELERLRVAQMDALMKSGA